METSKVSSYFTKSRQKNCNACVQTKRRCDRRTPICSRCAEKKTTCQYGKTKVVSQPGREEVEESTLPMGRLSFGSPAWSSFASGHSPNINYLGTMPMDFQFGIATTTTETMQNYVMETSIDDNIPMDPLINFLGNSDTPTQDQWLVQVEQRPVIARSSSPADEEIFRAYEKMSGFCDNVEPWHLYDSKTPLYYVVTRVKGFTTDVATRNATPFLHRYLYRDYTPQCILSCFTASVIYANRTQGNAAMVMRTLHISVREFVSAEASRVMATPVEKLARTQALFLYQIIRLLDGDVILRAQGEKDIPLLQTWLGELCKIRENLGESAQHGDGVMRKQLPTEWKKWIFAESLRRTIIIAYSFITLYEMMTNPEKIDEQSAWVYAHRWTLSRHLWEADSSFKFARIWKEKPHFIITNYAFQNFLEFGRGEDIDEFAEILLSVYMGVDETHELISANNTDG